MIAATLLGAATLVVATVRLSEGVAINPWEPAIAMEAMRLNAGLPVYEPGHARHMYGPLLTVLLAGIFRVAGLDLLAARIAMSMLTHRARRISRSHLLIARLRRSISALRRGAVGRPAFSAAADYVQFG